MSALFSSVIEGSVTIETYLICLAGALVCGIIAAFCAGFRAHVSKSFLISLVLLPMIVETVITMVNGNIGTGVAVMGAFSLVRFRSVPGKAKDIASIFLSMTAGLACAAGYVGIAVVFCLLVGAVMLILNFIPFANENAMELSITVPESLNFSNAFEDIFKAHTSKHRLVRTKTTNMGSLYKLTYSVVLKDKNKMREFIDELRCRNGNLEIALSEAPEGCEVL
ncbi:MAG: DUF4956 domain-containing protein [Clostridia bacterium]|nr:DUF4956 domain-containing protein [Clostridia bacterium]